MFLFFKQKTAYEVRISDWSSDVCSSDLRVAAEAGDHRRVEGVGDGRLTEQEVATLAEALAAVAPDRLDAVDVGLNLRGERVLRCAQVEVHRQGVSQRREASAHSGADATRKAPRRPGGPPRGAGGAGPENG